ncbi:hypothetical protein [Streptomyces sp. JB150]|uniref:hypothetical protein n=1 Tax=Streptomyces sp. JB150 TaxID=2714844 RepID=UPI00140AA9B4|nr:hypothetical protein G7Z13_01565 [Streptomyces sp. JB150]
MTDRPDNARALVEAGADPWRRLIGGWSPGRLALAGPTPDPFPLPEGEPGLSDAERAIAGFVSVRHAGAALLWHVDPRLGLREGDFRALAEFGRVCVRSGRRP